MQQVNWILLYIKWFDLSLWKSEKKSGPNDLLPSHLIDCAIPSKWSFVWCNIINWPQFLMWRVVRNFLPQHYHCFNFVQGSRFCSKSYMYICMYLYHRTGVCSVQTVGGSCCNGVLTNFPANVDIWRTKNENNDGRIAYQHIHRIESGEHCRPEM